jgi:hypothetical protein
MMPITCPVSGSVRRQALALAIEYVPAFAAAVGPSRQRFEVLFVHCAAIR